MAVMTTNLISGPYASREIKGMNIHLKINLHEQVFIRFNIFITFRQKSISVLHCARNPAKYKFDEF